MPAVAKYGSTIGGGEYSQKGYTRVLENFINKICTYCKQLIKPSEHSYEMMEVPFPVGRFRGGELIILKKGDCVHARCYKRSRLIK